MMDEWTIIAVAAFGLSSLVSAIKLGRLILDADPGVIAAVWRWSIACLILLALGVVAWLSAEGRWTSAMMVAAFIMPILVQSAPYWRSLLGPVKAFVSGSASAARDDTARPRSTARASIDAALVEQSIAVLNAYLDQTKRDAIRLSSDIHLLGGPMNGSARKSVSPRMSTEDALDILGLDANPSVEDVIEAHHRLKEKLDQEFGGARYLAAKINEAKQVLLEGC